MYNNDQQYDNQIVGTGNYQGGRLWIECCPHEDDPQQEVTWKITPQGRQVPGRYHNIHHQVTTFKPQLWHEPEAWSGYRRVLTGYTSRGHQKLEPEQRQQLQKLGFHLPPKHEPRCRKRDEAYSAHEAQHQEAQTTTEASSSSSFTPAESARVQKQLYKLHAATGHGSVKNLVDVLKRRSTDPRVIELARNFQCSVCKEKGRIQPRHLASLEVLPPKWHTIAADIGHWRHPRSGDSCQFMLIIDEGSRYRAARILSRGKKQQPSTAQCLHYLREGWVQYFGMPRSLRLDPAGSFRSQELVDFCDREQVFLDVIPADAHWQIGVCEQAVQGVKEVMSKLCADDEQLSADDALSMAVTVFNSRDDVRGFTPMQHVFGRSPDSTDRLVSYPPGEPRDVVIESATAEFRE